MEGLHLRCLVGCENRVMQFGEASTGSEFHSRHSLSAGCEGEKPLQPVLGRVAGAVCHCRVSLTGALITAAAAFPFSNFIYLLMMLIITHQSLFAQLPSITGLFVQRCVCVCVCIVYVHIEASCLNKCLHTWVFFPHNIS